jgi:hypothetical protein
MLAVGPVSLVGDVVMIRHWWWSGCVVAALCAGCGQAIQDAQKAAEDSAAEMEKAAAEMAAEVENAGQEAVAEVEQAAEEGKAAVENTAEDAKSSIEDALGGVEGLDLSNVDPTKQLNSLADGLNKTLEGITDVESAKAALPKLEEANLGLDKALGLLEKIPEAVRPALAAQLKTHTATITETIQKVVAIEGVGEIVKPVLDQIVAKLERVSSSEAAVEPAPAP